MLTFHAVTNIVRTVTQFPSLFAQDVISDLKQQFQERFSDLDACSLKIRTFENPFDSVIEDLPPDLQMEIIDLQSNDILKDKFKKNNLRHCKIG